MLVVILFCDIFLYNLERCGTGCKKDFLCVGDFHSLPLRNTEGILQNMVHGTRYYLTVFSLSNADKTECCFKCVVESSQDVIMFNVSHSSCVKSENVQNY